MLFYVVHTSSYFCSPSLVQSKMLLDVIDYAIISFPSRELVMCPVSLFWWIIENKTVIPSNHLAPLHLSASSSLFILFVIGGDDRQGDQRGDGDGEGEGNGWHEVDVYDCGGD
jgi:hypothetical protein